VAALPLARMKSGLAYRSARRRRANRPSTPTDAYDRLVGPLADLQRVWLSSELPGYREHPTDYATYSGFAFDELPPIERSLDDELRWLLREPTVQRSLARADQVATRPATLAQLMLLLGGHSTGALPRSFTRFIESDEPRARIRSCTNCYLDLADFAIPVSDGGWLIHFLSDSQWVLHWLLYSGPDGSDAVAVTDSALGFELGDDEDGTVRVFDPSTSTAAVCADSFSEFLYRFWIENEIWFNLADPDRSEPRPLSDEQRRYAEHYGQL
jgi:hypothetical protein